MSCFSEHEGAGAFRLVSVRGLSGKPDGEYTTELLADDVAAFMQATGLERAHVFGVSLGASVVSVISLQRLEVETLSPSSR